MENRVQAPTKAPSEGSDGAVPDEGQDQSESPASDSDTSGAKTEEPTDGAAPDLSDAPRAASDAPKAASDRTIADKAKAAAQRVAAQRAEAAKREAAQRDATERAEAAKREAAQREAAERAAAQREAAEREAAERAAAQREAAERAAAERAAAQREAAERASAERAAAEQAEAADANGTAVEATGQYGSGLMGVPPAQDAATEAARQAAPSGSASVPSYTGRQTPTRPASNTGTANARALASRLGSSFSGLTTAKPKPKSAQKPRPRGAPAPRRPAPAPVGQESRRAQLSLERVEPWSVMKFSFLLSLVGWVILFVAVAVLYFALSKLGVFHKIETTVGLVTSSKDNPTGANAASWFSASRVLGYTMLVGAINVVVLTALATIGAVLYNIVTSLTGGIEVTLKESD